MDWRSMRGTAGVWLPCDGSCRTSRGVCVAEPGLGRTVRWRCPEISHVIVSAHGHGHGPEWAIPHTLCYEEPPMLKFRVPSAKYGQFRGWRLTELFSNTSLVRKLVTLHSSDPRLVDVAQ